MLPDRGGVLDDSVGSGVKLGLDVNDPRKSTANVGPTRNQVGLRNELLSPS